MDARTGRTNDVAAHGARVENAQSRTAGARRASSEHENEKRKTKNEKRKTKNEKRKTKNEKRKTKNEKRKTKNEKRKCPARTGHSPFGAASRGSSRAAVIRPACPSCRAGRRSG
ncbi:hypothetical protein [Burkholderia pseudomallei]|uniref:hypothetical protein n=1 Tax=Burkholderia pseudomallei TaxID=28450 RepID=UPI0012B04796|nr:hypothetical protein [Burkholderia pseudomallei]